MCARAHLKLMILEKYPPLLEFVWTNNTNAFSGIGVINLIRAVAF